MSRLSSVGRVLALLVVLVLGASAALVWAVRADDGTGSSGSASGADAEGGAATAGPTSARPTVGADGTYQPGQVGSAARQDALAAAVAAVPPALSYDYAHLDRSLSSATSRMTSAFAAQFRDTFAATVRPLAREKQAVTQARVRAAGVVDGAGGGAGGEAGGDGAGGVRILVFVDQVLVSSKAMRRSETPIKVGQTRVLVTMVPVGNAWKVDDILPL